MTPASHPCVLELDAVTVGHPGRADPVVRDLGLELRPRTAVCLQGRSGAGKSSVIEVAAGFRAPRAGRARWLGRDVAGLGSRGREQWRARHLGYLDQEFAMLRELTLLENVLLPLAAAGRPGVAGRNLGSRAVELMAALELDAVAGRAPSAVSVGERQRAALARALLVEPVLVLLDEPTARLDERAATLALRLLDAERDRGAGVLVASHDPLVLDWADMVVPLDGDPQPHGGGGRTPRLGAGGPRT